MSRSQFSHGVQDEYYTPVYAVKIILPYLKQKSVVWCPFDKEDSNYVKELRNAGHFVYATHIDDGADFLTYEPDFSFDYIVSNPPFSIKDKVLAKCIELGKPFALLLPFTMFNSISTVNAISKANIKFVMMDRRISFNGERPNFTCWYVTNGILENNVTYLFHKDPRVLYNEEQK